MVPNSVTFPQDGYDGKRVRWKWRYCFVFPQRFRWLKRVSSFPLRFRKRFCTEIRWFSWSIPGFSYNKHLITLVFSVRTVNCGSSFFPSIYGPSAKRAGNNLQYGPSLLLRRFVFRMAEASAKRVTGDTPQGTMGRVQTLSPSRLPLRAHRERRLGTRQEFQHEKENEKDSGHSSKMTSSCKWPVKPWLERILVRLVLLASLVCRPS